MALVYITHGFTVVMSKTRIMLQYLFEAQTEVFLM